jgi:hypothetical protein
MLSKSSFFSELKKRLTILSLLFAVILPSTAYADIFGFWIKPKMDFVSGTGEVFKRFEGQPAGGLEVGLELLGLSFWGDAEFMSESQYWASGNVGIDFSFGDTLELTIGAYGGVIFFGFPKDGEQDSGAVDAGQKQRITELLDGIPGMPISYDDFESTYNEYFGDEDKLSNTAFGLNGRLRLSLEYKVLPLLSIGMQASSGYHYIMTGEEAAGSAKSLAVDSFVATQPIPDGAKAELKTEIKDILGAEEVNVEDLKGVNYSVGAFVNFSF